MLGQKDLMKWLGFGAITGAFTGPAIKFIADKIPGVNFQQAAVTINLNAPNTGLSQWLMDILKVNATVPGQFLGVSFQSLLMGAAGGAIFVGIAAILLSMFDQLKGDKMMKVAKVVAVGTLASAFILSGFKISAVMLGIPALIAMLVGSIAIAFIYTLIDEGFKLNLIPN